MKYHLIIVLYWHHTCNVLYKNCDLVATSYYWHSGLLINFQFFIILTELTQETYLCGIKYHATPPMKWFRQLSGGSKTVTALAFLFGIHRYATHVLIRFGIRIPTHVQLPILRVV
jgi:hypothetical protein